MGDSTAEVYVKGVYDRFISVVPNRSAILAAKTECVSVFHGSFAQNRGGVLKFRDVNGLLALVYPCNSPRLPEHYRRDQASPGYYGLVSTTNHHHRQHVAFSTLIM